MNKDRHWYAWRQVDTRIIHGYEVRLFFRFLGPFLVDDTDYQAEVWRTWELIHITESAATSYLAWVRAEDFINTHREAVNAR
jgi:hypothetical protein